MSTSPVRISLVGAVLAAALSITGCGDSSETVNTSISNFDSNSDKMEQSAWNMPTNLVNTYDLTITGTNTVTTPTGLITKADVAYKQDSYTSFRKITAYGEFGKLDQTIGAVQVDGDISEGTYALGRDGSIYEDNSNWEVAYPAGIALNETWVTDTDVGYEYSRSYFSDTTELNQDSNYFNSSLYYEYPYNNGGGSTITAYSSISLTGITVAKITETNATFGAYTGLTKIVYTTTYLPDVLPAGATTFGLNLFSKVGTLYWKSGVGAVSVVNTVSSPNYIRSPTTSFNTMAGSHIITYTYELKSSSTPAGNG